MPAYIRLILIKYVANLTCKGSKIEYCAFKITLAKKLS